MTLDQKRLVHVLLPLFLGSVIAYLDRVNLAYAALAMNGQLGFSASVFGFGAGIFFAGYILFEIPGALIAERWSARVWLARIMISWGLVSAVMAFMKTEWQFYTLRFVLGAAEASFYPVAYATVIPRWFSARERPRALAWMLASLPLSAMIGSPLAGWLLAQEAFGLAGWQMLFIVEAIPALVFGGVLLLWLKDDPHQAPWLTPDERQLLVNRHQEATARLAAHGRPTVGQALADRRVWRLCLIYFLWITGFWGYNYWMPTVLKEASGWSSTRVGWMIVIPMTLALVAMVFVGMSSARCHEQRWHAAIPLLLGAVGLALGPQLTNPFLRFGCLCLAGIGVYGPFGVWWSMPTNFLSGAAAAAAVGLINSCGNIGGFLGPYLTGVAKDLTGSGESSYGALAAFLVLAALLILTLRENEP